MPKAAIKTKPNTKATRKASTRLERPAQALGQAYGLLADQPISLAGLSPEERAKVVISAVLDADGKSKVLSRA
ncbi:MAG: integrase, partial [Deltaproteobacteria bacterium]